MRILKWPGLGHPASEVFQVGAAEASSVNFDIVIAENAPACAKSGLFEEYFDRKRFAIIMMFFGPQQLGWPVRRTRMYAAAINLHTLLWLGAPDPKGQMNEFLETFAGAAWMWKATSSLVQMDLKGRPSSGKSLGGSAGSTCRSSRQWVSNWISCCRQAKLNT